MTQNYFVPGVPTRPGKTTKLRYSEVALRYSKVKGRLFENLPKVRDSDKDYEPLYSSFAANAQFRAPVSSKDVLQMKLLQRQRGLIGGTIGQPARERQSILKPQEVSQSKPPDATDGNNGAQKGGMAPSTGAVNFQGSTGPASTTSPDATGELADAKNAYELAARAEDLPLPMATQTLFKRVQSQ